MFCTYLTIYRGNKMPMYYIGHTSIKKIENGYHGSVSSLKYKDIWKFELKNNPHLFKTHIISIHETREEAICKENLFHSKLNVLNSMYINEFISKNSFFVFNRSKEHAEKIKLSRMQKNYKHSEETKEKISNSKKGKPITYERTISEKTKHKISESLTGYKHSEEIKEKMSKSKKGKILSDSHKNSMRKPKSDSAKINMKLAANNRSKGMITINDGIVEKKIFPPQIEKYENWNLGRLKKPTAPSQKGKVWANNGIECKMLHLPIPEGWKLGRKIML